jgi:glycosyltransferase involved in cell wall biosynthesis
MSSSLTIAIVTRNRAASLKRLLTSLEPQRNGALEVLISDDSDGHGAEMTRDLADAFGCSYMPGPRRGLYANRNASALKSQTTHVRTMDDDHELPPGHIEACLAAISRDPEAVWTLSELRPGDPQGDGRGVPPGQLNARGFSEPPAPGASCWAIADGATIYPRSIFTSGHLFVDDFVYGAAYLEFGSRLHSAGFRIRHLEETYVIHHAATRSTVDRRADLASRFFAMLAYALKHQPTVRNRAVMTAEIGKQFALHPTVAPGALRWGHSVYQRRIPMLHAPTPAEHDQTDTHQAARAARLVGSRPLRGGRWS